MRFVSLFFQRRITLERQLDSHHDAERIDEALRFPEIGAEKLAGHDTPLGGVVQVSHGRDIAQPRIFHTGCGSYI